MPVDGPVTDSSISSGSRSGSRASFYPSPFFDIAGTYFPETPKALFRFCRYYYYTVGVIGAAVDVHAAYPVTDIEIDTDDEKLRATWKKILHNKFKIKSFLLECGKDYICYGNCFVSLYIPFKRFLVCPDCKVPKPIDDIEYVFRNYKFQGPCEKCGHSVDFKIQDEKIKDWNQANLVRWSPENLDIDYNQITGQHHYKYLIPNEVRRQIQLGKRHMIESTPPEFIDAMKRAAPIIFNPRNIFHMKRASLAEKNMGWGEPALIRVLKDTYYLQVLRKAREAVAQQHIVPLWVLFPQPQGELNPYEHLNLAEWRGRIEQEIKTWRQDPNYIPVMPIPLGFQFIGGNFKNLDTTPEMQNLLLNILAGMNMPQEFIYGGLQYSGTSFSIRMLSNLFSSYRTTLLDFINNFLIPRLSEAFSLKPVTVHFTDLKLADDIQKKTLLMQLNQLNKVSTATLLSEIGLDARLEVQKVKKELDEQAEIMGMTMEATEKAKGKAMLENIRGQVKAQLMQNPIMMSVQKELAEQKLTIDPTESVKINPQLYREIFEGKGTNGAFVDDMGKPFFMMNPVSIPDTVRSLAKSLMANNERDRMEIMTDLQNTMPMMAGLVQEQMGQVGQAGAGGNGAPVLPRPGAAIKPEPTQKPPRQQ